MFSFPLQKTQSGPGRVSAVLAYLICLQSEHAGMSGISRKICRTETHKIHTLHT
jgi:hypothetical protein